MVINQYTIGEVVARVLSDVTVKKATKYIDGRTVIKCTRQGKFDGRNKRETYLVTFGIPNYAERDFIRLCKKAKEPFPVRKIQLKFSK